MKAALLLVDLQADFLAAPGLEPAAGAVTERAAALLAGCRQRAVPIIHVWTTVRRESDDRMPHWRRDGKWTCVEGTAGHAPPSLLAPRPGEPVIHKTFFSAFSTGELDRLLGELRPETLLVAGVHLHGCVRSTVLDAYQRGFEVVVAEDAVASDDPLQAALSRRWLEARAAAFRPAGALLAALDGGPHPLAPSPIPSLPPGEGEIRAGRGSGAEGVGVPPPLGGWEVGSGGGQVGGSLSDRLEHRAPHDGALLWRLPAAGAAEVRQAVSAARRAFAESPPLPARQELLARLAEILTAETEPLARLMAREVGKPVRQGRGEVARSVALLAEASRQAAAVDGAPPQGRASYRYRPVGAVAAITPWNNPLGIPIGKIAPAVAFGNTVVWKPAPSGTGVALRLRELMDKAGWPAGLVEVVVGGRETAESLLVEPGIDAVTLSGSPAAGRAAAALCARRWLPLQAELGGNNGAIVAADVDRDNLEEAARRVVEGAFGFAGQRCTANRRVIVEAPVHDAFLERLSAAAAALAWGDPDDEAVQMGPLVSTDSRDRVAGVLARAAATGATVLRPHPRALSDLPAAGAYHPPAIVVCDDPGAEIVQEETFGPVLVVQRAASWEQALELLNGVRQGLAAALFSPAEERRREFLSQARAGILKIGEATADAAADLPFGGWKASGVGPPEHGPGNREFYTRAQAVYRREED